MLIDKVVRTIAPNHFEVTAKELGFTYFPHAIQTSIGSGRRFLLTRATATHAVYHQNLSSNFLTIRK